MPMLDPIHGILALSRISLELCPPLESIETHETEAEEDDGDELDAVDHHVGDEGFNVARGIVALEDLRSNCVPDSPGTVGTMRRR